MSAVLASGAFGIGLAFSQMASSAPAQTMDPPPVVTSAASAPALRSFQQVAQAAPVAGSAGDAASMAAAVAAMPVATAAAPALPLHTLAQAKQEAAASATPEPEMAPPAVPMTENSASVPAGGMQPPAATATKGFRFPTYTSVNVDGPYIAITFDDGPNPETTPKLLKELAQRNIKATFFVVGSRVAENPDLLRRMVAEGHEIGNHSWNHPQLPKVSVAEADRQVETTSEAIRKAIGSAPIYLRPPYGAMTQTLRKHIEDKFGLTMVYWSADSLDWKNRNTDAIYSKVMAQTRPGGIILLHDIHATTVAAMPKVLDALLAKGYKFVTVSQLIAMQKATPPKAVAAVAAVSPTPRKKPKPTPVSASAHAPTPRPATASKPLSPARVPGSVGLF